MGLPDGAGGGDHADRRLHHPPQARRPRRWRVPLRQGAPRRVNPRRVLSNAAHPSPAAILHAGYGRGTGLIRQGPSNLPWCCCIISSFNIIYIASVTSCIITAILCYLKWQLCQTKTAIG